MRLFKCGDIVTGKQQGRMFVLCNDVSAKFTTPEMVCLDHRCETHGINRLRRIEPGQFYAGLITPQDANSTTGLSLERCACQIANPLDRTIDKEETKK